MVLLCTIGTDSFAYVGRYRSGQTGLTVNQVALPSGVRIPPGPPHFALRYTKSFAWRAISSYESAKCAPRSFAQQSEVGHYDLPMYFVYILKLKNGQFYIGFTRDLKKRLVRHKNHSSPTTSRIEPEELVFYSAFKTREKALDFEKYLKSSSGFAFRNKRLI